MEHVDPTKAAKALATDLTANYKRPAVFAQTEPEYYERLSTTNKQFSVAIWFVVIVMGIGLNPYFRGEIYGEVRFVVPYTYLQFIFPAVIVLNILYTSVQSAVSTIWDREFGFLREILVSPLPRATVLLGKILGGTTVALFHGSLVLALARFADLTLTPADIAKGLGLMFLLAFALCSLGVVIANRVRSFEGFGVFSNAVILPLYFTSSSIFPPVWLRMSWRRP